MMYHVEVAFDVTAHPQGVWAWEVFEIDAASGGVILEGVARSRSHAFRNAARAIKVLGSRHTIKDFYRMRLGQEEDYDIDE